MRNPIKVFISVGDAHISIESDPDGNNGQVQLSGGIVSQDIFAMAGIISSMMRIIMSGKPLCFVFRPEQEVDLTRLVMCEWLLSGTLRIKPGVAARRYQHAETAEQALVRTRAFTCEYALALRLPAKRESKKKVAEKVTA